MAPAVAALAGIGVVLLARAARTSWVALVALDLSIAGTAWLSLELLGRTTDAPAWAPAAVPVAAVLTIVLSPMLRSERPTARRLVAIGAVAGSIAILAGPASYSFANLGRALNGNNVLAGPAGASSMGGGPGGGMGRGGAGGPGGTDGRQMGTPPSGQRGGGMGGGVSDEAIAYLEANQGSAKYLLAATGSQTTSSIIIQTGKAVVTIGGFSGNDPAPTVSQLSQMVASGELKYVLIGGGGPGGGSSEISRWVQEHGTAVTGVTVGAGTLYAVAV